MRFAGAFAFPTGLCFVLVATRPGAPVSRPDPGPGPDRRRRRLDPPPSLRSDLEPRPSPPDRRSRASAESDSATPCLQAGHGLAARDRPALRLRPADRRADPRLDPAPGLRACDRDELLHPVDAARHLVALAGLACPDPDVADYLRGARWRRSAARSRRRPATWLRIPMQPPVPTPRQRPSLRRASAFALTVPMGAVTTDMSESVGGGASAPTPGWLLRAPSRHVMPRLWRWRPPVTESSSAS